MLWVPDAIVWSWHRGGTLPQRLENKVTGVVVPASDSSAKPWLEPRAQAMRRQPGGAHAGVARRAANPGRKISRQDPDLRQSRV